MKKITLLAILVFSFVLTKANSNIHHSFKNNFTYNTSKNYNQHKIGISLKKYAVQVTAVQVTYTTSQKCCDGSSVIISVLTVTYDSQLGQILGATYYNTGNTCSVGCA